jgi:hypothetical protein
MERLKAILADKILDLSTNSGDEVKAKVDKIQRFRDFANACKTLMIKYPGIEDELINMVEGGDFDTKVASSRVDTIIRLADTEAARVRTEPDSAVVQVSADNAEDILGEEESISQPEDVDYEELQPSPEEEAARGYVSYEDMKNEDIPEFAEADLETPQSENIAPERNPFPSEEETAAAGFGRKVTIRRVALVVGVILAIVALIFVIKFVMAHWQTILIVAGIFIVLTILIVWSRRKRS